MIRIRKCLSHFLWKIGHLIARFGCIIEGKHFKQGEIKGDKSYCTMCGKLRK